MRFLSEISWTHSQDVSTLVPNNSEFLIYLSVCQLAYFLTDIKLTKGYLQFWMRFLSEISWRFSWNDCSLDPNNSEFLVCLSVCQLAYFLTEIRPIQGYLWSRMSYLIEFFLRHSQDVFTQFPNNSEFFVCLSVCQLAYFLTEIRQIQGYLLFLMRYISEIFWRHS